MAEDIQVRLSSFGLRRSFLTHTHARFRGRDDKQDLSFKPEAAQAKLDAACDRAERTVLLSCPLTIHGLNGILLGITSFLQKRPVTNLKAAKSLRKRARQSSVRKSRPLIRDPSIPQRGLPPLQVLAFTLGIVCCLNFGKGLLLRYLNAREPLPGDDFTPVNHGSDPEKVEFPSNQQPIPTFSAASGKGNEIPVPAMSLPGLVSRSLTRHSGT
ncbi:hypothetical protein C8J55DRAFT_558078 [Lentinula edodes]|uniref:Uncharacterized protein n=1 Tax=Lentinula lateritia TaxID=40482 RepID=A0A9W9DRW3_9AGAR|nr:hypothetical protein C8J55DRAFT_559913 [Lentinula edodes]KAJ4489023.1 hypothetical protein C8J55DRAFT_558078 [Lentinula edodes]